MGILSHVQSAEMRRRSAADINSLNALNKIFDECPRCASELNPLQHVYGGGATRNPKYCFVLINPTHLNISTHPEYRGPRFPFIGVRQFWRILHRAGLLSGEVLRLIEDKQWKKLTTQALLSELRRRGIYVTNLVKCAQPHPDLPANQVIQEDFPLLTKEISLINPELIVAFGQLPFKVLTGETVKLYEYYDALCAGSELKVSWFVTPEGKRFRVVPTFFPTGRGNPRLSTEILRLLSESSSTLLRGVQLPLGYA